MKFNTRTFFSVDLRSILDAESLDLPRKEFVQKNWFENDWQIAQVIASSLVE